MLGLYWLKDSRADWLDIKNRHQPIEVAPHWSNGIEARGKRTQTTGWNQKTEFNCQREEEEQGGGLKPHRVFCPDLPRCSLYDGMGAKGLTGLGTVGKERWQSNSRVVLKSREGSGRKSCHGELQTAARF